MNWLVQTTDGNKETTQWMFAVYYCCSNKMGYICFTESKIKMKGFYFAAANHKYLSFLKKRKLQVYIKYSVFQVRLWLCTVPTAPSEGNKSPYQRKSTMEKPKRKLKESTVTTKSTFLDGHNLPTASVFYLNSTNETSQQCHWAIQCVDILSTAACMVLFQDNLGETNCTFVLVNQEQISLQESEIFLQSALHKA